ncbi:hypothetical protein L4C34_10345 [Vibrio profundum]|uniref:hypothetical protein n=1 Tax=Vibrio profundum TaxID=2910247 RepID=UPI003D14B3E2
MVKVKIYKVDQITYESVVRERLATQPYTSEGGFGFDVIDDDNDKLVVQFIEKQIRNQEIETPDGDISMIESVSYIKVKFCIRFNTKYALYVIDPPRSMKYPFEMIRTLFDLKSNLQPLEFDLKALLQVYKDKYDLVVKSMSLSNIQYDAHILAKSKIASTKNLHPFFLANYSKTPAIIDIVHMIINGIDTEVSRTGRFRVHEANLQTFISMLEHSFQ